MNGLYLIPANSKKSLLIFGLFNKFDLVLFASGILITLVLSTFMEIGNLFFAILTILPAGIATLLVFPIPQYHNVLTAIISVYTFLVTRRAYIWKGWCISEETNKK